jgi:nucleolar protein 12
MIVSFLSFQDRECVDEILAIEPDKTKFAKRKLRVQRCKAIASASTTVKKVTEKGTTMSSSPQRRRSATSGTIANARPSGATPIRVPIPWSIPKGDPNLGKQLEHLSKEERKKEKAANAERVARRLAKKQVKAGMAKGKSKFETDGKGKERARVRKKGGASRAAPSGKMTAKKTRARSDASLTKRNMKK